MGIRFITDEDVISVLHLPDAISAIENVLSELSHGKAKNMPRIAIETELGVFRSMSAYSPGLRLAGVNQGFWSSGFKGPKDKAKESGLISLYDSETAELSAIVRAPAFNEMRVGALTAVGVKHLANKGATSVGLIGSSSLARNQLLAVSAVRSIDEVRVYSREQSNRERFCKDMAGMVSAKLTPVGSAKEAIMGSEIILEATDADTATFDGSYLVEGAYVSSTKTGRHGTRQIDDETIRRASLFVIDFREQALIDGAGDVLEPVTRGLLDWKNVVELGDVIAKKVPGRVRASDVVVFKSCGMAINDLALARLLLDKLPTTDLV
ncbi:MAG: ornithine cyclodeaminase family protein [Nitrososphaerales archaeon]